MKIFKQVIGIILGALYGLAMRVIMNANIGEIYIDNVFSFSFFWIVPIVIAIIPILFAREEILKSTAKQFYFPIFSVFLFFIIALVTKLEDLMCLLILSLPYLLIAGIIGLIAGFIINKRKANRLLSIAILPFILSPIEDVLPNDIEYNRISSEVIINKSDTLIWNNLIEVPEIKLTEYNKGFFNYMGIPRPIHSKLKQIGSKEYRIGYFSEGLELYETIAQQEFLKYLEFEIHIDQSKLRDLPTDSHVLKGSYFSFESISYTLEKLGENKTKLVLSCSYKLESNMNGYANFWAQHILYDFETRLLESLKFKFERTSVE